MSRRSGSRSRAWLFVRLAATVAVCGLLAVLYVYVEVTTRFEGQIWKLPSRIYSDRLLLHPGDPVSQAALMRRLVRCGYAASTAPPSRPGEYRRTATTLDAFLRSFEAPWGDLGARRVVFRFQDARIASIRNEKGRDLERAELEPELLAALHGAHQEEREVIELREVPGGFVQALLAAEDARFYSHHGVDPLAVLRAAFANMRQGRIVQGGSTITQQLVKNLYLGQERTWWRKAREALMAPILDLRYSKDRILEVYVNEVYLGQRGPVAICGVQAASRFYFGRDLRDLSLGEWALLAGLVRNPGGSNPFVHAAQAIERRNQVLDAMQRLGYVEAKEAERARAEKLHLGSGAAGFVRAPYVAALVRSQLSDLYATSMLEESGLRIFTTVDTLLQENAETALREGLERLERTVPSVRRQRGKRTLQGCLLATEPRTGSILALVGGRDYRGSQFDRVVQARRQPGSCFKPFVFLAGFEAAAAGSGAAWTPATILQDEPLELVSGGKLWRPENYDGIFRGPVSVRQALENSLNVPTVRAAQEIGLDAVVDVAGRCGLPRDLKPLPSLALGAQEVTPLELATAYGVLAQQGRRANPIVIRDVVGADGRVVSRRAPIVTQVVRPEAAYLVADVLRGVLSRGTGASASALGFQGDAAGKTGTTDDTRDAWFVGFTPEMLALTWVGYDDNSKTGLTGAAGALPIWVDFMMRSRTRWGYTVFPEPEGVVRVEIDPESGMLAVGRCPNRQEEVFIAGTEPTEECPLHSSRLFRWFHRIFRDRSRPAPPEA